MWVLCTGIASRHPFDAQNLGVNPGYSPLEDLQFWHWKIISIYTKTFLQIAQHLGPNIPFLFEFGGLLRYKTFLDYQEYSNSNMTNFVNQWHSHGNLWFNTIVLSYINVLGIVLLRACTTNHKVGPDYLYSYDNRHCNRKWL